MRAHFIRPITDSEGNLIPNVEVSVFDSGTTDLIVDVLYDADTGDTFLDNPFISETGIVDFYLDVPARVRLGVTSTGATQYYEDVDVLAAGVDSQHIGAGTDSLVIGHLASSTGDDSVALGPSASSGGSGAVAMGLLAVASGISSTALGQGSAAQDIACVALGYMANSAADSSTALGDSAHASGANSTAVGSGAQALHEHSIAIGAGAQTTSDNQIMLGSGGDTVEVPAGSGIILTSPGGTRYRLTVNDDGSMQTDAI